MFNFTKEYSIFFLNAILLRKEFSDRELGDFFWEGGFSRYFQKCVSKII